MQYLGWLYMPVYGGRRAKGGWELREQRQRLGEGDYRKAGCWLRMEEELPNSGGSVLSGN